MTLHNLMYCNILYTVCNVAYVTHEVMSNNLREFAKVVLNRYVQTSDPIGIFLVLDKGEIKTMFSQEWVD